MLFTQPHLSSKSSPHTHLRLGTLSECIDRLRDLGNEIRIRNRLRTDFPTLTLERNVLVKGDLRNLLLGPDVIVQCGTVLHLGGMKWCDYAGQLEIGAGSVVSHNCVLYAAGPGGIRIGRNFDCGPGVGIFASRTDYLRGPDHHLFAPVVIGDEVIVYANAVIGPGVSIGDGATVAANSVVTANVPPNSLVGGSPARILRSTVRSLVAVSESASRLSPLHSSSF